MTENESMFCQVLSNVSLLVELWNNDFLNSCYYNHQMHWSSVGETNANNIKKILAISGLGNPAMLQMFMYALLVMPKELLGNDYCKDLFNKEVQQYAVEWHSTYPNESNLTSVNFYRHIRNAVAHSRCTYSVENQISFVTFKDRDGNNNFSVKIATGNVGKIFELLLRELMKILNKDIS